MCENHVMSFVCVYCQFVNLRPKEYIIEFSVHGVKSVSGIFRGDEAVGVVSIEKGCDGVGCIVKIIDEEEEKQWAQNRTLGDTEINGKG